LWEPHRHRRLVEPFCGGLAVTLSLAPVRALLNDINPHVVNFYRWLKRGLVTPLPMRNDERLYYAHRERFNRLLADGQGDSADAAALFYYLNRTGYNGLCRFNRRGEFNVPFGRYNARSLLHRLRALPRAVCGVGVHGRRLRDGEARTR
jgi:DNA adenine methylase